MTEEKRRTGYIPDPKGKIRTPFARLAERLGVDTTPPDASLRGLVPVLDQGQTGSCTGHASALAFAIAMIVSNHAQMFLPSPAEIYRNGRAIDRAKLTDELTDDGAMPNAVFRAISEYGLRPIKGDVDGRKSDADPATINDEPTLDDLEAERHFIPFGEYGITSVGTQRVNEIRQAIATEHAVTAAIDGGSEAFQGYTSGVLGPLGGELDHYITIVGYRTNAKGETEFEIQNSWSEQWGDAGHCWVSQRCVQQLGDLVVVAIKGQL